MERELNQLFMKYTDASGHLDAKNLSEAVARYPQFEKELVEYAVNDFVFETSTNYAPAATDKRLLSKAKAIRERMLPNSRRAPLFKLWEAAKEQGMNLPQIATVLNLSPAEAVKLENRLFKVASLPRELVHQIASLLDRSFDEVVTYLQQPPALVANASYKSNSAPQVNQQVDFAEEIMQSRLLTSEQKSHWQAQSDDIIGEEV